MQETLSEQSNCDRATTASCPSNQAKEFRNTAKKKLSVTGNMLTKLEFTGFVGFFFFRWGRNGDVSATLF